MSGGIGEITAVDFRWYLDRVHGADYFRRWHRGKDRSGGLFVHKATHHFDLVNWWVDDARDGGLWRARLLHPGDADAPGPAARRAVQRPARTRHATYCLDLPGDPELKPLYLDAERDDGYVRDRCIFANDISIEDTMRGRCATRTAALMNYTLCAYSPWEGYEIVFYGTEGELNHRHVGVHGIFGGTRHEADDSATTTFLQIANGEEPRQLEVWGRRGRPRRGETRSCSTSCSTRQRPTIHTGGGRATSTGRGRS